MFSLSSTIIFLSSFLLFPFEVAAQASYEHSPIQYIPSIPLTSVAFSLTLAVAILQAALLYKWKTKWMLPMTIGAFTFATGIGLRYGLHYVHGPGVRPLIIMQYMLISLSPCAFIATDYILLGRLADHLAAGRFLLVSSRRLTLVFVLSDIFTFLIQSGGGALLISSDEQNLIDVGTKLFMTGLILQAISFFVFTGVYAIFVYRVYKKDRLLWISDSYKSWHLRWTTLAGVLGVSCVGILIRSGYRVAEISEGFSGRLSNNEGLFYAFDTLPLFVAISVYVPFWPGRIIRAENLTINVEQDQREARHGMESMELEKLTAQQS